MDIRYNIVEEHAAQGGFSKIDKAWDNNLERLLAIKTLDPLFRNASAEDKDRFTREAKALASFNHPNIPAVYDLISDDESELKILFQWVDGITVKEYLKTYGVLNLDQVRNWFGNICSALSHAHSKQIIHRDIKPSNLIITNDFETCYLVDFGIALKTSDYQLVAHGTPTGTPGYMSPEQERGEELTPASDLYNLGLVLYECLAGTKPTAGQYISLNSINETIPSTIDELIQRCLRDKTSRIQSAAEFHEQLRIALRPRGTFSHVLSQGSLENIIISLSKMTPEEFSNLPLGQRSLLMTRLKDMIRVDAPYMRNPVALLLSEIVRLSYIDSSIDFEFIITNALNYGYEVKYGEQWHGNIAIRSALNIVAFVSHTASHRILACKVLDLWNDIDRAADKETWYIHDLRILLQQLLANDHCTDDAAERLAPKLDRLNELTHLP